MKSFPWYYAGMCVTFAAGFGANVATAVIQSRGWYVIPAAFWLLAACLYAYTLIRQFRVSQESVVMASLLIEQLAGFIVRNEDKFDAINDAKFLRVARSMATSRKDS